METQEPHFVLSAITPMVKEVGPIPHVDALAATHFWVLPLHTRPLPHWLFSQQLSPTWVQALEQTGKV